MPIPSIYAPHCPHCRQTCLYIMSSGWACPSHGLVFRTK